MAKINNFFYLITFLIAFTNVCLTVNIKNPCLFQATGSAVINISTISTQILTGDFGTTLHFSYSPCRNNKFSQPNCENTTVGSCNLHPIALLFTYNVTALFIRRQERWLFSRIWQSRRCAFHRKTITLSDNVIVSTML